MARRLPMLTLPLAVFAVFAVSACSFDFSSLQFTKDNRLTILSPKANTLAKPPLLLRWRMRDFAVTGPHAGPVSRNSGYFAVFIDRSPVRPGQSLTAVGADDPNCRHTSFCSSKSYLTGQQVYTTTHDHLKLPTVSDIQGNNLSTQYHTATVVLMNTAGRRIGESAWSVDFKMHALGGGS